MSIILDVKVVPGSGKNAAKLDKSGALVIYVKSQAERGMANAELIKYVAKSVGVSQQQVAIVGGLTSRKKRIAIDVQMTKPQILSALGIEEQMNIAMFR
jgi:uncharacterized protein YggU (UPF0235/DUF167 family)